jgi:hypothetical protein
LRTCVALCHVAIVNVLPVAIFWLFIRHWLFEAFMNRLFVVKIHAVFIRFMDGYLLDALTSLPCPSLVILITEMFIAVVD